MVRIPSGPGPWVLTAGEAEVAYRGLRPPQARYPTGETVARGHVPTATPLSVKEQKLGCPLGTGGPVALRDAWRTLPTSQTGPAMSLRGAPLRWPGCRLGALAAARPALPTPLPPAPVRPWPREGGSAVLIPPLAAAVPSCRRWRLRELGRRAEAPSPETPRARDYSRRVRSARRRRTERAPRGAAALSRRRPALG